MVHDNERAMLPSTSAFHACPGEGLHVFKRRFVLLEVSDMHVAELIIFCLTLQGVVSVLQAMKEGSVEGLDRCLQEHQIRFIQAGTYLLLEKLKNSVYRRLFRKVALLHKEQEPAKAAQVPLCTSPIIIIILYLGFRVNPHTAFKFDH